MTPKKPGNPREMLYRKMFKSRWMKVVTIMAGVVVFCTVYSLILPAITMSIQDPRCGYEEHVHTDECYDAEGNLICGMEEHTHTLECYSDLYADIEDGDTWYSSLPELTGDRNVDVINVAASQLGGRESEANFLVAENEQTKGYTRYGHWYGDVVDGNADRLENGVSTYAYADWDAMFASFVLNCAGIDDFGYDSDAGNWAGALAAAGRYADAADYVPQPGDLIFFTPYAGAGVHVGIVSDVNRSFFGNEINSVSVILGDSDNSVEEVNVAVGEYNEGDVAFETIHGYGILTPGYGEEEDESEPQMDSSEAVDVEEYPADETVAAEENQEAEASDLEQEETAVIDSENEEQVAEGLYTAEDDANNVAVTLNDAALSEDGTVIIMNWDVNAVVPEAVLPADTIIRIDTTAGKAHHMTVEQAQNWALTEGQGYAFVADENYEVTFIGDNGNLYSWEDVQNMDAAASTAFDGVQIKSLADIALSEDGNVSFSFETTAYVSDAHAGCNYYVAKVSVNGESNDASYMYENGKAEPADQDKILRDSGMDTEETKTLKAGQDDYTVTMSYGSDAQIPDGAKLYAKEIKKGTEEYNKYIEDAKEVLGISEEAAGELLGRFFDIKIMTKDGEFEPKAPVNVNIEYRKAFETEDTSYVSGVHFSEDGAEAIPVETVDVSGTEDDMAKVKSVEFSAESFSVYGVVYTVDFEYTNPITGEVYYYSLNGGDSINLSELLVILGIKDEQEAEKFIAEEVKDVTFSDPDLVKVSGNAEEGWTLESLKPFETNETLTILLKNDEKIVVKVTDATYTNLADFITDASLTIDGHTYGNETWPARPDVDYELKLSFEERGSRQFPKGGDEMIMDLPAGLTLKPGTSGKFDIPFGLAGTLSGNDWWVSDDGKLHIKFADDPKNLLTRANDTHMNVSLFARFDGSTTHFDFNDRVSRDVEYDNSASASVTKSGTYNPTTGKMEYVLTVKSTGKTKNVKVTDAFNNSGLLTLDQNSIVIEPNKELNGNPNTSATGFDLTIKEIGHNETVTIKYTASVDTSKLGTAGKVEGETGKNTVTVKPENGPGDEKENIVNQIKFSDTAKSSVSSTDNGDGTVDMLWKIDVNKGLKGSLVGAKITDKIDWNSKDIMKYASHPLTLDVVVKDSSGNTVTTLHPTVNVDNPNNQGQETWTYTIPKINNDKEVYSYEISYHTTVTKQSSNVTVKNDSNNEADDGDTGSGLVPGTGSGEPSEDELIVAKTPVKVTEEFVEWNIIVNVPPEGFDELVVTDYLPWHYGDKHPRGDFVDTLYEEPTVSGLDDDEDMSCVDTKINAQWGNDPENLYLKRDGQPLGRHKVTMTFTKQNGASNGLNAHARTVTITIKTKNDPLWMDWAAGDGGNAFNEHRNYGKVNNTDIEGKAYPVKSTIKKKLGNNGNPVSTLDGVGLEGPFYYYDIVLSNVTEEPIIIDDTFDDTMEFVDLSEYPGAYQPYYYVGAGINDYDNITSDQNTPTYTVNEDGTLHIEASNLLRQQDQSFYPYYHIRYYLRVKNMDEIKQRAIANGGSYKVGNTAVWNDLPGHYDIEFDFPPLTKEGEFASSDAGERLYNFVIDVNPTGATLNNGAVMDLKDTHTENLSVDYSTVKVYRLADGVTKDQRTEDMIDDSIVWNFDANEGTFKIPDETHYVITYSALVIGSGPQDFSNYAEMNGFFASKEDSRTFGGEADAGGSILQINLLKYEAGKTSNGLQGTTFQLYKGTGEYDPETGEEIKEEMKYGDTPYTRGEQSDPEYSTGGKNIVGDNITFTTGSDGTVLITLNQTYDGNQLDLNTHYYLKEIDSPPGYQIDSSVEYWSFTLTTDPDEVNYGDDDRRDERGNRQWIYFYYGDILKMANTPTTEPINVKVDKTWFDVNGDEITDENVKKDLVATVQLLRKTDKGEYVPVKVEGPENNPTVTEVPTGSTAGEVQLKYSNDWSYSWKNLPRVEYGGEKGMEIIHHYAYKIEEVNVDGYIVAMTESENETTKTYSLKNYKRPEDRNTDITVKKEWQDADGNPIDGTIDKLPDYIDTYIYQVASKTPFTRVPTSGGNKFIVAGDSHLLSADDTNDNYGVYQIKKSEQWTATFNNLPEVVTDNDGNTIYYAYYAKEKPVTGYTTTYTSDGITRTIINKEPLPEGDYIEIGLEKKWTDGTHTTPPEGASAKFTVHQQKSTKSGVEGTIQVTITANGETTNSVKCNPGDKLNISVSGNANDGDNLEVQPANQYLWTATDSSGKGNNTYTVPDTFEGSSINVKSQNGKLTIDAITVDGEQGITYSDYEDTGVTKEITLPYGSSWSYTIKNLIQKDEEGNLYRYYITEDSCTPEATNVEFKDKDGNDIKDNTVQDKNQTTVISENGKKVEVTNTYEELLGSLKITKAVTLNHSATTDARLNGTYSFEIYKDGEKITKDGKGNTIPELSITITDGIADPAELTVDNLEAGSYIIKETASTNPSVTIDTEKTVTVTAGNTVSEQATAAFTNDYETTEFSFEKEWKMQDGTTVDTNWPEDVNSITVTVNRRIGNGSEELVGTYEIRKTESGFDFSQKSPETAPSLEQDGTGFKFKISDLTKKGKIGDTTGEYTYYVAETKVEGYKDPIYYNPSATDPDVWTPSSEYALNGGKIINIPEEAYDLPQTGGYGTSIFYAAGFALLAVAGCYWLLMRFKRT